MMMTSGPVPTKVYQVLLAAGPASPFKPHLFKSITKSSFEVSSQPLSGHHGNDWPCCEPSSYLLPLNKRRWLAKN
jgi:hypothetical protein